MLRDRDEPAAIPETVHAIIAARLDALPADEKAVLQDAAVLGQTGWTAGITAVGGHDRRRLEGCLARLEAKEFLHRARHSSVAGEREYGFRHMLVRDVTYGQIPRGDRADKHRRAAAWLEDLGEEPARAPDAPGRHGSRAAGRAELVAYHCQAALAFARAAHRDRADLAELAARARVAFRDAGDRVTALGYPAEALDAAISSRWLEAARAFVAGDARQAAEIYAKIGSRPDEAEARLEAARRLPAAHREAELEAALAFYREVGAIAYLNEAEALRQHHPSH
jgi:hypothetical protein